MIPKISLENLKLSKIVCGTNQFVGITHRWNPIDIYLHLRRFKEPKTIAKFLIYLNQQHEINCCISSPRDKILEAIKITQKEIGEKFHWLCTPSRRKTAKNLSTNMYEQIDWCYQNEVSVCLLHRNYTDHAIDKNSLTIGKNKKGLPPYPELSSYIRDKGMIPGLSTHYIETIKAVQKNNYDAPLITQPLNKIGFQSNANPGDLIKVIQETPQQIINIKPMGAGRIQPREGLQYCLQNIKKNDYLAVGFGKFEHCMEDGKILEELLKEP